MKKVILLLMAAALLFSLAACGAPTAEQPSGTLTAETARPQESETAEAPAASLSEAEKEIRERSGTNNTTLRDRYTAWANEIILESLQKLADRGEIAPLADEELISWKIPFVDEGESCQVAFLDPQRQEALTQPFTTPLTRVILMVDGYVLFCYGSQEGGVPWFTPVGYYYVLGDDFSSLGEICGQYADRFSETMADCDYLIWIDGCLSHVDEDFYNGSIDRRVITTMVLIVDVKQREVLHMENLGTDTPARRVKLPGGNIGQTYWEESLAYLSALLAQSS